VVVPVVMGILEGVPRRIVNRFLIVKVKIVPFIATMGMLSWAGAWRLSISNVRVPISNFEGFRFNRKRLVLNLMPVISLVMLICVLIVMSS
jgi:ribose/xylose/arabinose/galactoside ABC-type transport system permease subunit